MYKPGCWSTAAGVLGAVWLFPAFGLAAESTRVAIVLPPADAYKDAVEPIHASLTRQGRACTIFKLPAPPAESAGTNPAPGAPASAPAESSVSRELDEITQKLRAFRPTVVVAAGNSAVSLALQAVPDVPVVFCAVANALDRPFLAADTPQKARVTGVTTDVAPDTQIEWIRRLSPQTKRVGILCSENSRRTAESLAAPARQKGMTAVIIRAHKDNFAAAIQELNSQACDGALMIADAYVYNAMNAQATLLWGLRGRKPVWTFSANLAKSGAFAAIYADPREMLSQTAAIVEKLIEGEKPDKLGLQYPRALQRAVNEQTSELIGITLDKNSLGDVVRFGRE